MSQIPPLTTVNVNGRHGAWYGVVVEHHTNRDGRPNGVTRVQVIDPGATWHKTGQQIDVGTTTITAA